MGRQQIVFLRQFSKQMQKRRNHRKKKIIPSTTPPTVTVVKEIEGDLSTEVNLMEILEERVLTVNLKGGEVCACR